MEERSGDSARGGMTRRDALKKGAAVGGALWVVPMIQGLSTSAASADQPSGGSRRSEGNRQRPKRKKKAKPRAHRHDDGGDHTHEG